MNPAGRGKASAPMVLDDVRLHSEIARASGAAWACCKLAQRVPGMSPCLT
jgi:hypothetical protein